MHDSIFTKIIKGEIPSHKVYEDADTYAFLDIHPIQPGHVLVIPKRQAEYVWDLSDEEYQALMETAKKVARKIREAFPEKIACRNAYRGARRCACSSQAIPLSPPMKNSAAIRIWASNLIMML